MRERWTFHDTSMKKRKRLVLTMEEVKENKLLNPQKITELLKKFLKGYRFLFDKDLFWFSKVALLKAIDGEQFVPFGEYVDFLSFYVPVTAVLRET